MSAIGGLYFTFSDFTMAGLRRLRWNHVRTVAPLAATAMLILSLRGG